LKVQQKVKAVLDYIDSIKIIGGDKAAQKSAKKKEKTVKKKMASSKWSNASKDWDPKNLFNKIVKGEIPCYKIFETDKALAFLDLFPCTPGHALLITKGPYKTIMDMPPEEAAALLQELPRLSKAVQEATGAEGVNILQNNLKAAGQVIPQVHFHVIPRKKGDKVFKAPRPGEKLTDGKAAEMLDKLKPHFE